MRGRCWVLLTILLALVTPSSGWSAGNQPIHPLPDPRAATFKDTGPAFWKQELPDYMSRYLPLPSGRVISGGVHATSGTCVSPAFALEALMQLHPVWGEYQAQIARLRKVSYDAHVKAGFSEAEAVVMCQTMMFK